MVHSVSSADHHGHHVVPKKTLFKVFLTLVGLTVVTVLASMIDLGPLNVPLAIAIAVVKAALVVLIFMALKYDSGANMLVFLVGTVFVIVFLTFTLFDTAFRGDVDTVDPTPISSQQRQEEALKARFPTRAGQLAPGANLQQRGAREGAPAAPAVVDSTGVSGPQPSQDTGTPASQGPAGGAQPSSGQ